MIHVIAIVTTKPGQRESVLQLFRANSPNVRAEKGFIEYEAAIDLEPVLGVQTRFGPDSFVVIERWEKAEFLQAHFKSPHMVVYAEKMRDLVINRLIHVLEPA